MKTDLALVFRQFLSSRSEAAFRHLYTEMTPRLYRFVFYRLAGDAALAHDAIQETWCRVVSQASRFGGRSSVSTWILGIALNVCREINRDMGPSHEITEKTSSTGSQDVAQMVDLVAGLNRLAEGYREVLLLHDLGGLTHEEISQLLGIEVGTSKSQLSRARSRLINYLEGAKIGARTT